MANQNIHNPKDYSEALTKINVTDPVHADLINAIFERLINNDAFIKALVDKLVSGSQGHKHTGVDGDGAKLDPTTALTYTPVNKAGDTMQGNLTTTGTTVTIAPTTIANAGLEVGHTGGNATSPFVDFHSGATAVDYDVRLQASGGTGTIGGGKLSIAAAKIEPTGTINLKANPNARLILPVGVDAYATTN